MLPMYLPPIGGRYLFYLALQPGSQGWQPQEVPATLPQPQEVPATLPQPQPQPLVLCPATSFSQQGLQQELATKSGNVMPRTLPQELQELHAIRSPPKKMWRKFPSTTSYAILRHGVTATAPKN